MNQNCLLFGAMNLKRDEIEGREIIEIGACDINGSMRPLFESYNPKRYIGVDIARGPMVDIVCDVSDLVNRFGRQSFDVVISTELLEHVRDWRTAIHTMKGICKPGGILLLTTRSFGFCYHGFPYDFWRYEIEDMRYIFQDCRIEKLEKDPQKGVFIKVVKPRDFTEQDLSGYKLYSIISNRRILEVTDNNLRSWHFKMMVFKQKLNEFMHKQIDALFSVR